MYSLGVISCAVQERDSRASDSAGTAATVREGIRDSAATSDLTTVCSGSGKRGSILVARVAPEEEEAGISFRLLGDGAGPGVVLCGDDLYADVAVLVALMGEQARVHSSDGHAIIDGRRTELPAYFHEGVVYVAVAPFARSRRALLVRRDDHRMDATIWPRATLLHMKTVGPERRGVYDSAVRAGLFPR